MEFIVDLNKVEDVKEFVRLADIYDSDIIVRSMDRTYAVDASSLMGVFSLDLGKPVVVSVSEKEIGESLKEAVGKYVM